MRAALLLQGLSAAALGVLLGAEVAEGALLVPWWRALPPADFLAWYAANAERLLGFFAPLTTLATVLAVAAAITAVAVRADGRAPAVVGAVLVVLVVVGFFVYFEDANHGFATGTVSPGDVPAALATWARWHWVRVAAMGVAFAASLWSLGLGGATAAVSAQARRSG
jgi:hypothetical protein